VYLQGHGHTKVIDRPLRFESMADDIAALIGYLKPEQADLLGYSLGGGVALQTVIRHPALLKRLILVSTAMAQNAERECVYIHCTGSASGNFHLPLRISGRGR
jgi:pimeloyl-ACP methyl ester carboxylesterase